MADTLLRKAVGNGQFVVTAECVPPRGADVEEFAKCAATLGKAAHAVYVPESEDGVRLSSLAGCSHALAAGAEPIMALLTRDMNRIALESTLLGAASMGVENVLCLTGRHQALTDCPSARGVFDVDPVQLLSLADAVRKSGELLGGRKMDSRVDLLLGTDVNPFAEPIDLQAIVLDNAVKAGADFAITQPVFNLDRLNIWMSYVRERGIHTRAAVIASVMPLTSARQAVALAQKFNHLDIRDEDVERLEAAQDQRAAGVHLAVEIINYLRKVEGIKGVHIMCGEDLSLASELISASGISRS